MATTGSNWADEVEEVIHIPHITITLALVNNNRFKLSCMAFLSHVQEEEANRMKNPPQRTHGKEVPSFPLPPPTVSYGPIPEAWVAEIRKIHREQQAEMNAMLNEWTDSLADRITQV